MGYTKTMNDTTVTMDAVDVSMDGFYPQKPVGDITEPKSVSFPSAKKEPYQEGKSISYPYPKSVFKK